MLETLVHLNAVHIMDAYTLLRVDVPDDGVLQADMAVLPDNWNAEKAPIELSEYGDAWVSSVASVGLRVPSALCPVEFNYLLNTAHPDYLDIVSHAIRIPFLFDTRLK